MLHPNTLWLHWLHFTQPSRQIAYTVCTCCVQLVYKKDQIPKVSSRTQQQLSQLQQVCWAAVAGWCRLTKCSWLLDSNLCTELCNEYVQLIPEPWVGPLSSSHTTHQSGPALLNRTWSIAIWSSLYSAALFSSSMTAKMRGGPTILTITGASKLYTDEQWPWWCFKAVSLEQKGLQIS